jgi:hypothetical protein
VGNSGLNRENNSFENSDVGLPALDRLILNSRGEPNVIVEEDSSYSEGDLIRTHSEGEQNLISDPQVPSQRVSNSLGEIFRG